MKLHVYSITSSLHDQNALATAEKDFLSRIESCGGFEFNFHGSDFSGYNSIERNIIFIRTGGTEGFFKSLNLKGDVTLLSTGFHNSLAASMEILAYLRMQGQKGRILHGTPESIAADIREEKPSDFEPKCFLRPLTKVDFHLQRAGVIGKPSDWLIASQTDYTKARALLGIEIVDIPMEELLSRLKFFKGDIRSFEGSMAVYSALKEIVKDFSLSALTLRCFDLLDSIHNTGCLALSKLNAEGIVAGCEGDIPAMISMMIAREMTNSSSFQCNLSRITGDDLLFAHCTVPLDMVSSFTYDTHFESGIGTAIRGTIPMSQVMLYKVSPNLDMEVGIPAEIIANPTENNLCRTQIVVRASNASHYFLENPLSNHHIVCKRF
ncbi:MAG: hypothetical protein KBS95_06165 [Alistipes sp.]|nr:hypothetical protein [Candidatus Alistipes equi]